MPAVTLVGYSWGAWLSFIVAARCPALVRKLILVSSGPFGERYVAQPQETRLKRLSEKECAEWQAINEALSGATVEGNDALLARLGALASNPMLLISFRSHPKPRMRFLHARTSLQVYGRRRPSGVPAESCWNSASKFSARSSRFTAVMIHIPRPASSSRYLGYLNFRFVLLKNCGHTPWLERQARDRFYEALRRELAGWDQ